MSPRLFWSCLVGLPIAFIGWIGETGTYCPDCMALGRHRHSAERPPAVSLKMIASAETAYRALKIDGKDAFWRADVAGLYARRDGTGEALKILYLGIAAADDRPVTDLSSYAVRSAQGGYWFRAIRHTDEDPQALDARRFAFCAFPDSPSAGTYVFIVDERGTVFRAAANGRRSINRFPTQEELETSWSPVN
ncbi:MAG TPA: hypothetical protein VKW04_10320 [Planctomycetota bacterium]|nr:hypothetical protein [Planctomycetota bacterium]